MLTKILSPSTYIVGLKSPVPLVDWAGMINGFIIHPLSRQKFAKFLI